MGGVHHISLRAYNDVSEMNATMTLMLLEDIEDITLQSSPGKLELNKINHSWYGMQAS